ncbi:MAG: sensor histidine kinase [Acidobacteriota bacterium]
MSDRVRTTLLIFAGSTLVGLFFASQSFVNPDLRSVVPWRKAVAVNLTYYWLYGMAVPVVMMLGRRFPMDGRRWGRSLAVHITASFALTAIVLTLTEVILSPAVLGVRIDPLSIMVPLALSANFHSLLPTYWMILAAYLAFQYYARARSREVQASQLEARLSEAKLEALKMQLRPHFLFNTLNSISSLIYSDREAADAMLARLADFLRLTIDSDRESIVPLHRELDFVRRYLEIEQIRLESRLRVRYDISPSVADAPVPTLILQPLVENAIHHGVASREEGGTIVIAASGDSRLKLSVSDDGPGLSGNGGPLRVGLRNTQARLEQTYGNDFELRIADRPEGGVIVEITIPT